MKKTCFYTGCKKDPEFSCNCEKLTLFCKKHMSHHLMIQADHNTASLYTIIKEQKSTQLKSKIEQLLKIYSKFHIKNQEISKYLIESIIVNSKRFTEKLNQSVRIVSDLYFRITRSMPIYSDDLKFVESLKFEENSDLECDLTPQIENITNLYDSLIKSIVKTSYDDSFLMYTEENSQNICCISLTNMKKTQRSIETRVFTDILATVQAGKNSYFAASVLRKAGHDQLYQIKEKVLNPAYLQAFQYEFVKPAYNNHSFYLKKIDLSNNKDEILFSSNDINDLNASLVFYNSNLFVFTGSQKAFKFEIEKKNWTILNHLPHRCESTSATIYKDRVLVTGFLLDYIYEFNIQKQSYSNFISFAGHTSRYLIDKWVVCFSDSFYQIKKNKIIKLQQFMVHETSLKVNSGYRHGRFIYILTGSNLLARIDTVEKNIKMISWN